MPCCDCRSNCSTRRRRCTITSSLVNRQDVVAETSGRCMLDPRRSAGRSIERVLEPVLQTHADAGSPDGGTVTLGYRCVGSGMTIVAGLPPPVAAGGDVALRTRSSPATAPQPRSPPRRPGRARSQLTKYVAYHSSGQVPEPPGDASIEELASPLRDTLDAAASDRLGAVACRAAGLARPVLGTHRHRGRRATTRPSRRSAGTCSRWPRPRPRSADAASPPKRSRPPATTVTTSGTPRSTWSRLLAYTNPDAARATAPLPPPDPAGRTRTGDRDVASAGRCTRGARSTARRRRRYYPAGTAQYHIDADVAYAIERYVTATGDTEFLHGEGAEILVELARLFADLGFYDQADPPVFHIHGVTGPDEYTAVVDDNVYTNVMARFTLRFAADVATRLRSEPIPRRTARWSPRQVSTTARSRPGCGGRRDVRAVRRRARHQPPGRRLPRPRAVGLGRHAERTSTRCCSTSIRW